MVHVVARALSRFAKSSGANNNSWYSALTLKVITRAEVGHHRGARRRNQTPRDSSSIFHLHRRMIAGYRGGPAGLARETPKMTTSPSLSSSSPVSIYVSPGLLTSGIRVGVPRVGRLVQKLLVRLMLSVCSGPVAVDAAEMMVWTRTHCMWPVRILSWSNEGLPNLRWPLDTK